MNQLETEVKEMIHLWETNKLTNYVMEKYFTKWKQQLEKENDNV